MQIAFVIDTLLSKDLCYGEFPDGAALGSWWHDVIQVCSIFLIAYECRKRAPEMRLRSQSIFLPALRGQFRTKVCRLIEEAGGSS